MNNGNLTDINAVDRPTGCPGVRYDSLERDEAQQKRQGDTYRAYGPCDQRYGDDEL